MISIITLLDGTRGTFQNILCQDFNFRNVFRSWRTDRDVGLGTCRYRKEMKFKSTPFEGHTQLATAVGLSTQGTNACSASADGTCRVWRIEEAICIFELPGDKRVACCNFSADGRMIITGDWGYQTRMWDAVEGQLVMSLAGHSGKLTASRFRADGNLMLTTSEDKHMRTWDPRRGVSVAFQAPDELLDGAFAPDMTTLVGACKNGKLLVWDVRKPDATKLEIAAHGTDWVTACAVAPGGNKVLTCRCGRQRRRPALPCCGTLCAGPCPRCGLMCGRTDTTRRPAAPTGR